MALLPCPECCGAVSDRAEVCVHCGFPLKKKEGRLTVICRKPPVKGTLALLCAEDNSILLYLFSNGVANLPIPRDIKVHVVSNNPHSKEELLISESKHTVLLVETECIDGKPARISVERLLETDL